jgi:hypothetical protein
MFQNKTNIMQISNEKTLDFHYLEEYLVFIVRGIKVYIFEITKSQVSE